MKNGISKKLYWTPRILSILFILFLMLFSLDVFEEGLSGTQLVIGLFIHNIPALVLTVVTIISWKKEFLGGIIYILAGLLYIILLFRNPDFELYMITWSLMISGPSFLTGILFLVCWNKKKRMV